MFSNLFNRIKAFVSKKPESHSQNTELVPSHPYSEMNNLRENQFRETIELLKSTTNCETFIERMNFAHTIAQETNNQSWIDYLDENLITLTMDFIDRAVSSELEKITGLKTEKEKKDSCTKFSNDIRAAFENYSDVFVKVCHSYLEESLSKLSVDCSSVTPHLEPSCLWTENVSNSLKERFVTAIFLDRCRKGSPLGNSPEDYPQYFMYDLGVDHPEQLHRKLISDGYITNADIETKLNYITIPEIKKILSKHSLPVSGTKPKLIKTALEKIGGGDLNTELKNIKITMLTAKGKQLLEQMEGYAELYKCGWNIYLYEYENLKERGIIDFGQAAEIILKERDKSPSFSTKLNLAQLYYKRKDYSLSLTYYIQVMYHETCDEFFTDDSDFAPANQKLIHKMSDYFSDDMIDLCYKDNRLVKSKMTREEFTKAVHKALKG